MKHVLFGLVSLINKNDISVDGVAHKFAIEFIITDVAKLGECEFFLISEMNSQLIIHHPYRTLGHLQTTLNIAQEDMNLAWNVINDHYLTDMPLLYPLHVIAALSIFLALTFKPPQAGVPARPPNTAPTSSNNVIIDKAATADDSANARETKIKSLMDWLAKSNINIKAMIDGTQDVISLYESWEHYNDKTCKEQIARFIKARNLDK